MNRRSLQEISKFAAGLVAADLITIVWLSAANLLPVHIMGLDFGPDTVVPAVIFDLALLAMLIHYGWHVGKIPSPREHAYLLVAGTVFMLVALGHIWRLFAGADLVIMGWMVPLWLSWFGVVITAYLSYTSFRFALHMPRR
jgi:hypothetical protein